MTDEQTKHIGGITGQFFEDKGYLSQMKMVKIGAGKHKGKTLNRMMSVIKEQFDDWKIEYVDRDGKEMELIYEQ